jgi:mevalonate kinase
MSHIDFTLSQSLTICRSPTFAEYPTSREARAKLASTISPLIDPSIFAAGEHSLSQEVITTAHVFVMLICLAVKYPMLEPSSQQHLFGSVVNGSSISKGLRLHWSRNFRWVVAWEAQLRCVWLYLLQCTFYFIRLSIRFAQSPINNICQAILDRLNLTFPQFQDKLQPTPVSLLSLASLHAQIAEHVIHGNPSGVDTTVSCYGGVVAVRPFHAQPMQSIQMPFQFKAFVVDTGVSCVCQCQRTPKVYTSNCESDAGKHFFLLFSTSSQVQRQTKPLVAHVGQLVKTHPAIYSPILASLGATSEAIIVAIQNQTLTTSPASTSQVDTIGLKQDQFIEFLEPHMTNAHALLGCVGVGHRSLDQVKNIANSLGIQGCKLTGAGGGGCAVIVPRRNVAQEIEESLIQQLEACGCEVFATSLGATGLTVHSINDFPDY